MKERFHTRALTLIICFVAAAFAVYPSPGSQKVSSSELVGAKVDGYSLSHSLGETRACNVQTFRTADSTYTFLRSPPRAWLYRNGQLVAVSGSTLETTVGNIIKAGDSLKDAEEKLQGLHPSVGPPQTMVAPENWTAC